MGSHKYAEEATDAIHVTVVDGAQNTITIVGSAAVADATLSATGSTIKVDRHDNDPIKVASFTDAGGAEAAASYTATIDWGDGSPKSSGTIAASGAGFSVSGSHAYQNPGRHTIAVTIQDEGGAKISTTSKVLVGADEERLIEDLFEKLLDRDADDNALSFFEARLNQGTATADVVAEIQSTTEFLGGEVQSLFQQLLHRGAEPGAVTFFSPLFGRNGQRAEEVIVSSPEYLQLHGGSGGNGFLDALYQDALGRGVDPGAQSFWSNRSLSSESVRDQIAEAVYSSDEFLTDLVKRDIQQYLGRSADPGALNAFVKALQTGATDEQVIAAILGSPEFNGGV